MNSRYKHSLLLLMVLIVGAILSRCSKEDGNGKPFIDYVRVTNPASSDSLLASAGQGQMVAIIGGNLQSVHQVWFNDQKSTLLPTFITNSTIITRVPSQIPGKINDKVKLVFANGDSLLYNFSVDISKPLIDHVRSEYVNDGDSLYVYGSYFYLPLTVTFTGGAQGTLYSVASDNKSLVVKVPTGTQPGPITITSNFGSKVSDFWFKDNRNIIASFDINPPLQTNVNNIWHVDAVVSSDPNIPNINGSFLRTNKGAQGAYPYMEVYEGTQGSPMSTETKNIPAEAFTNPSGYSLKFEISTLTSLNGANLRLYLGDDNGCCGGDFGYARNTYYYVWQVNLNTFGGKWQTVTIPWADVYNANSKDASNSPANPPFVYNSAGYGMGMYWHGPNPANYNYAIDNIRVVPNK